MELGFDLLLSPIEAYSFVFQAGRCSEIDNVVTAALLPHQPDQLQRRDDWYDNGERATPLDAYRRRNGTKRKFFNDFSRARMRARATERPIRVYAEAQRALRDFLDRHSTTKILVAFGP